MKTCNDCTSWLKKAPPHNQIKLENSFTKINGELHLAFDRSTDCSILANYSPDVIILAGDGAIEVDGDTNCWSILNKAMSNIGIIGPDGYKEPAEGLTWLAANLDFLSRTVNFDESEDPLLQLKAKIVGELCNCNSLPRNMYCVCCNKHFKVNDSHSVLILTTNWELGLFLNFKNVIQLHGRCDYPKQAVLPLQNLSRLMARDLEDLRRLNAGFLPSTFLKKSLNRAKYLVFWGSGINDYDAALWHFLHGFAREKHERTANLEIGIAAKDREGFVEMTKKIGKYFPAIPINNCVCKMIPH